MAGSQNDLSYESKFQEQLELIKNLTDEKNSILKIVSHDIKGPFNQVFALLQLLELESDNITPESKIYIDKIYMAVIGGMEMVKNLNDSRAIDNGNITLRPEKINLKQAIRQSIRNFSIQRRVKKISIEFDDSMEDLEITADKILLTKVLDIVISNAVKYSEIQSVIIVKLGRTDDRAIINIRDHGPGLPEEEIPLIFEKFKKLSPKPTLGEATTGLGMYLSRAFMNMLNGNIEVKNNREAGLEVEIKI